MFVYEEISVNITVYCFMYPTVYGLVVVLSAKLNVSGIYSHHDPRQSQTSSPQYLG